MGDLSSTQNGVKTEDAWDYARNGFENTLKDIGDFLDSVGSAGVGDAVGEAGVVGGTAAPFAIIDLPTLAFAVFGLILFEGFEWIVRFITEHIPNPSIFGYHPLGFIAQGFNAGANVVLQMNDSVVLHLRNVIIAIVHQLVSVFSRDARAVGHVLGITSHLFRVVIPGAASDATNNANTHSDQQIAELHTEVDQAAANIEQFHNPQSAQTFIDDYHRFGGVTYALDAIAGEAILEASTLANNALTQAKSYADQAEADAKSYADANLSRVEADLVKSIQGDEIVLQNLSQTIAVTVPAEIANAVADSYNKEQSNLQDAVNTINTEIASLQGQINDLQTRIANDEQVIASNVSKLLTLQSAESQDAQVITAAQQAITSAQFDILSSQKAIDDIQTNIQEQGTQLQQLQTQQQLNTSELSPFEVTGAVTLTATLAALSASINAIKTELDTCAVTTCDGPNNIANVLKSLLSSLLVAGEFGFFAEAISNPQGTANALEPILDSINTGATDLWSTILEIA